MINQFSRTEILVGKEGIEKLRQSKVAIFGIGGVGSFVVEGLIRAGVQNIILVDKDDISISNINRQIIATHKTVGMPKVDVMKDRILEINPEAKVEVYKEFYLPNMPIKILDNSINYIVDAVDTVTAKIGLIEEANRLNIPIISSMGTGNKLDPTKFEVSDIYSTTICPLAKVMRKELRRRGIEKLKVVYSKEEPIKNECEIEEHKSESKDRIIQAPGSISFVPSVAGLIIAGEVIKDIINKEEK